MESDLKVRGEEKKCLVLGCKPLCCILKESYRYGNKLLLQNGPHLSQSLPPIYITHNCLWWVSASFLMELVTKKHNDWHLLFWKRCDLFHLKAEWTTKWNWNAWRTPQNTPKFHCQLILFGKPWSLLVYYEKKKKKKPDSYHMPSDFLMWQPICVLIPSFCGSESKTWQFRV